MVSWTKMARSSPYYKPSETFRDVDKFFDEKITLFGSSKHSRDVLIKRFTSHSFFVYQEN